VDGKRFDTIARRAANAPRRVALRLLAGAALAWPGLDGAGAACAALGKKCGRKKCCPGGKCKHGRCRCTGGLKLCGGTCVDTQTDAAHCGGCGLACHTMQTCEAGDCACPPGSIDCGASCDQCCSDLDCAGAGVICEGGLCCIQGGQVCSTGGCCFQSFCLDGVCQ
jgi:hypothetical protein